MRKTTTTAILAAALLALVGCDLGSKDQPAASSGTTGPATSFTATAVSGDTTTQVVQSGTTVRFGPAASPGFQITLSTTSGSTISYSDPTVDCNSTAAGPYPNTGVASPVTVAFASTDIVVDFGFCFFATSGGGTEGARRRVTINFDTTAPTPTLTATLSGTTYTEAQLTGANPPVFDAFPTIRVSWDTTDSGFIHYTTDNTTPTTDSTAIAVTNGVGASSFVFSDTRRTIRLIAVDDVGNVSPVVAVTIRFVGTLTDPNAGSYPAAQDVQLFPINTNFQEGISRMFVTVCTYDDTNGYQCDQDGDFTPETAHADTDTGETAIVNVLPDPTSGYPYDFGGAGSGDDELLPLDGIAGRTILYDLKFAFDPDGDATAVGDLDAFSQAVFVIDRDDPLLLIYPSPSATTNTSLRVSATVFDPGYVTVQNAFITDFNGAADQTLWGTGSQEACANGLNTQFCLQATAPTLGTLPNAVVLPTSNVPAAMSVTARDAAGNTVTRTAYLPIGRTVAQGPAATDTQLGKALAAGNFNGSADPLVCGTGCTELPQDVAVGEPGRDAGAGANQGVVYIFLDGMQDAVNLASTNAVPADLTGQTALDLTMEVDGTTVVQTVDPVTRGFLSNPASVTASQLATAFNQEVMALANDAVTPVDLQVYMTADSSSQVTLRSRSRKVETCITVGVTALATALGLSNTRTCVYDAKITGEAAGDNFGHALAVGDFNGDGFADLAVGAPNYNSDAGQVYLFYGSATPFNAATCPSAGTCLSAAAADVTYDGTNGGDNLGWSMAAGDLDNNCAGTEPTCRDDLVVGAPGYTVGGDANAGKFYILYAGHVTSGNVDASVPGTAQFANPRLSSDNIAFRVNERFGHAIMTARMDVGTNDQIVVGSPGVTTLSETASGPAGSENPGRIYYYDPVTSTTSLSRANGSTPDSKFGWSLAYAGNFFGSDCEFFTGIFSCLAVGAPHDETTSNTTDNNGSIGIYVFGSIFQEKKFTSPNAGDEFGVAIASGDIDGDGLTDLFVGQRSVPLQNFAAPAYGGLRIFQGQPSTPSLLVVARGFSAIDWNRDTGVIEQSAFGAALLPVTQTGASAVDYLVVGAPGGLKKVGTPTDIVPGRYHVLSAATFALP